MSVQVGGESRACGRRKQLAVDLEGWLYVVRAFILRPNISSTEVYYLDKLMFYGDRNKAKET